MEKIKNEFYENWDGLSKQELRNEVQFLKKEMDFLLILVPMMALQ
jgi:hypothetical protein